MEREGESGHAHTHAFLTFDKRTGVDENGRKKSKMPSKAARARLLLTKLTRFMAY